MGGGGWAWGRGSVWVPWRAGARRVGVRGVRAFGAGDGGGGGFRARVWRGAAAVGPPLAVGLGVVAYCSANDAPPSVLVGRAAAQVAGAVRRATGAQAGRTRGGYEVGTPAGDTVAVPGWEAAAASAAAAGSAQVPLQQGVAWFRDAVVAGLPRDCGVRVAGAERVYVRGVGWGSGLSVRCFTYEVMVPVGVHSADVIAKVVAGAHAAGGLLLSRYPCGSIGGEGRDGGGAGEWSAQRPNGQVLEFTTEALLRASSGEGGNLGAVSGVAAAAIKVRVLKEVLDVRERPVLAIALDDAGENISDLYRAQDIGRPVTLAVLPGLRHSRKTAQETTRTAVPRVGAILHLPMEPMDPAAAWMMGPGGVFEEMDDEEVRGVIRANLEELGPDAVQGLNNHMGSKGTRDARLMRLVSEELRGRGMYFVDSVTTPDSVGKQVSLSYGVPSLSRTVFLDNSTDAEDIRAKVREMVKDTRRYGWSLAIGHANRANTAEVLREMVPDIEAAGITIVPLKELVEEIVPMSVANPGAQVKLLPDEASLAKGVRPWTAARIRMRLWQARWMERKRDALARDIREVYGQLKDAEFQGAREHNAYRAMEARMAALDARKAVQGVSGVHGGATDLEPAWEGGERCGDVGDDHVSNAGPSGVTSSDGGTAEVWDEAEEDGEDMGVVEYPHSQGQGEVVLAEASNERIVHGGSSGAESGLSDAEGSDTVRPATSAPAREDPLPREAQERVDP